MNTNSFLANLLFSWVYTIKNIKKRNLVLLVLTVVISIGSIAFGVTDKERDAELKRELLRSTSVDDPTPEADKKLIEIGEDGISLMIDLLKNGQKQHYYEKNYHKYRLIGGIAFVIENTTVSPSNRELALSAIREQLNSEDPMMQQAAIVTLSRLEDKTSINSMLPLLSDKDEIVRSCVSFALAKIGDENTVKEMEKILKKRCKTLTQKEIKEDVSISDTYEDIKTIKRRALQEKIEKEKNDQNKENLKKQLQDLSKKQEKTPKEVCKEFK